MPLTLGAAAVESSEENHEQLDWIAEDISDWGGDAWVLLAGALPRADGARIRRLTRERRAGDRPATRALAAALQR